MQIFYINTEEYKPPKEILEKYKTKNFTSKEKEEQHLIGRFLIDKIAKEIYKINNRETEIINKKPKFKNADINFNISHSGKIILAAFDKNPIGVDVEEMKERNFKEIFARYNYKNENISRELFYKFWTEYEAGIKLQGTIKTKITTLIEQNYTLTVVGDFDPKYMIYKVKEDCIISIK